MKKLLIGVSILGAAFGALSATATYAKASTGIVCASLETRREHRKRVISQSGGLDLMSPVGVFGFAPKDYGRLFGHGNRRKHTNRLRCSHNAKLKRR